MISANRTRKHKITIDSAEVSSSLTDFAFAVTRDHLADEVVSPTDSNRGQSDGGDIQFSTDSAGNTRIACEIVTWEYDNSDGAGDAVIEAHVLVPSVSSVTDTDIYIWYNTPTTSSQPSVSATYGRDAVWADYDFVCHMQGDPSATIPDATGNNTITMSGSMTSADEVSGAFGGTAFDFDGVDDGLDTGFAMGDNYGDLTAQLWVKRVVAGSNEYLLDNSNGTSGMAIRTGNNDWSVFCYSPNVNVINAGFQATIWRMLHTTYEVGTGLELFQNSVSIGTDSTSTGELEYDNSNFFIGIEQDLTNPFRGGLDEVRIRNAVISDAQIASEYSNQNTPATFATPGTPEAVSSGISPWYYYHQGAAV